MALFNPVFTFGVLLCVGVTDKDLRDDTALLVPEAYRGLRSLFCVRSFSLALCAAVLQAFVAFGLPAYVVGAGAVVGAEDRHGQCFGAWAMGHVTVSIVVLSVHMHVLLYHSTWYWFTPLVAAAESLLFFATVPIMNAMWTGDLTGVFHVVFDSPVLVMTTVLALVMSAACHAGMQYIRAMYYPADYLILRELDPVDVQNLH